MVLASVAFCIQLLYWIDRPLTATLLFGTCAVFVFFSRKTLQPEDLFQPGRTRLPLLLLLWFGTIALRCHGLTENHSIHDLQARFMVAAIEITRGNLLFPCIPRYEFDETLISWFLAPVIMLFGSSWIVIKITSIALSSLIVPSGYLFIHNMVDRHAAMPAAGFLMVSSYFQFSDPLIDMTRFSLVATSMMLAMLAIKHGLRANSGFSGVLLPALLTVIPAYLHSLGRIVFCIVWLQAFCETGERSQADRKRVWIRMSQYTLLVTLLMIPFISYVLENPAYLDFKERQVFGIHEAYLFSWQGLADNIRTVLGSFTYRSMHHMLFSETRPLMHPLAGAGAIGGILLLIRTGGRCRRTGLSIAILITTLPLIFLTPGHWRGLYMAPALIMLNLLAGVFYSWCVAAVTGRLKESRGRYLQSLSGILMVLIIGGIQMPWIIGAPGKAPESDQLTRLYADLQDVPDVPHYFSKSVGGLTPGYALFDLFDSKIPGKTGVIDLNKMLVTDGIGLIGKFSDLAAVSKETRLILTTEDMRFMPAVISVNRVITSRELPDSGLILVVIRSAS